MNKNYKPPRSMGMRPHDIEPLLCGLHQATAGLLGEQASLQVEKEIYAIFDERSTCLALAMLSIGFSRYARITEIEAEEKPRNILVHITGTRRVGAGGLSYDALLPGEEKSRLTLEGFLARSHMAYQLQEKNGRLILKIVLKRFLADDYDIFSIDEDDVYDDFYDAMLFLAGKEPKSPMPF